MDLGASRFHALLIGVDTYRDPRLTPLPATARDAQALAAVLTDPAFCRYPPAQVQVLTGPAATRAALDAALRALAAVPPDAVVLVYFSGHGAHAGRGPAAPAYLCPTDADPADLPRTALATADFSDRLAAIPAHQVLVLLDACHAAGAAAFRAPALPDPPWADELADPDMARLAKSSGRVVLAAAKAGQLAYNRLGNEQGLFTWHLVAGLRGAAARPGRGWCGC